MSSVKTVQLSRQKAVQYLRMSSDHQRYSIEQQTAAIAEFSGNHGYEIIRTYADPGKSGLSLRGRVALQKLLSDALQPGRDFDIILVLDVSRWGRFQDLDQAAHYEFVCKQAGIKIIYCAEPFADDNSISDSLMKHLKRIMAREYSRELSEKLSRAHHYHARLGFSQGGVVPYGFRRQLVDYDGNPRCILQTGDRKAISGDRVLWVPGPLDEIDAVRRIFGWYVNSRLTIKAIARKLREQGGTETGDRLWSASMVRKILTNEIYLGRYVYNQTSSKLQNSKSINPESLWIRTEIGAPTIHTKLFVRAQTRILENGKNRRLADAKMLSLLDRLLRKNGSLTTKLISESKMVPGVTTFRSHFGTIEKAYEAIGYVSKNRYKDANGEPWTDDALLECLRMLHSRQGFLSVRTIDEASDLPSSSMFRRRFGSVGRACECAGFPQKSVSEINIAAHVRRSEREGKLPGHRRTGANASATWRHVTSAEMIDGLRRLVGQHGYLSDRLIDGASDIPSASSVARRFGGSLLEAYRLAGWTMDRQQIVVERERRRSQRAQMRRSA
ncbi:recombinase family protein [Inquilinus sp. OTU3971]|uniref:recombinase family protein n=1 Tax=Inquilinus sp. OTU3971 TaxID=3043855 RepID=UPI00313D8E6F